MLLFKAYRKGQALESIDLSGCYIFGHDNIPLRADIVSKDNMVCCNTSTSVASAIVMPWYVGKSGTFLLNTNRLPERNRPYNLNLEFARGQLARLYRKREDWALFDHPDAEDYNTEFERLRDELVDAVIEDMTNPESASLMADKILDAAVTLGERLSLLHADILKNKRLANEGKMLFGGRANLITSPGVCHDHIVDAFDFVTIPTPWRLMEPAERQYNFKEIDHWLDWASMHHKQVAAGPLLCLNKQHLPDWIPHWKDDFETMRILLLTHVQRVLERFGDRVDYWTVISGLSVNNYDLEFPQITELTRSACQIVKKLAPKAQAMIEISMPWGEYYARNQRSVPPLLYADLVYQNDMKFDAFAVPIQMGIAADGFYVRDLLQISEMLEEFLPHGKDVHINLCGVPSGTKKDAFDQWQGRKSIMHAGMWHKPWNEQLQAEWLHALSRMAISKPFVKSICWGDLADIQGKDMPHGGLLKENMAPKQALLEMIHLRRTLNTPDTDNPDQPQ